MARLLFDATGGVIRGYIETEKASGGAIIAFSALVPTLNNYDVVLFRVRHDISQYPATLLPEWGEAQPVKCDNDADLEAAVLDYCAGPELQKIVTGLFAQADQAQR